MKTVKLDLRASYGVFAIPRRSRKPRPYLLEEMIQIDVPVIDPEDAPCVLDATISYGNSETYLIRNEWNGQLYKPRKRDGYYDGFIAMTIDEAEMVFTHQNGFVKRFNLSYKEPLWRGFEELPLLETLPFDIESVIEDRREACMARLKEITSGFLVIGDELFTRDSMPLLSLQVWKTDGGRITDFNLDQRYRPEFVFGLDRLADVTRIANEFGIQSDSKPQLSFEIYPEKRLLDQSREALFSTMGGIHLIREIIEEVFADLSGEAMSSYAQLQRLNEQLDAGDGTAVHAALDLLGDLVENRFMVPSMPDRVYSRFRRAYTLMQACVTSGRDFGSYPKPLAPDDDESLANLGF